MGPPCVAPNGDVCCAPQVRAGPQDDVAHERDAKLHLVTVALVFGLVEQLSSWEVGWLRDEDRESVNDGRHVVPPRWGVVERIEPDGPGWVGVMHRWVGGYRGACGVSY